MSVKNLITPNVKQWVNMNVVSLETETTEIDENLIMEDGSNFNLNGNIGLPEQIIKKVAGNVEWSVGRPYGNVIEHKIVDTPVTYNAATWITIPEGTISGLSLPPGKYTYYISFEAYSIVPDKQFRVVPVNVPSLGAIWGMKNETTDTFSASTTFTISADTPYSFDFQHQIAGAVTFNRFDIYLIKVDF